MAEMEQKDTEMGFIESFILIVILGILCVKTYKQVHFKCVYAKYSSIWLNS